MATVDDSGRAPGQEKKGTSYLILDTESIPDGRLLRMVKYPGEALTDAEAVARAQADARERSTSGSDFIALTFQYPVAICVIRVGSDFRLQNIKCLDAPHFRTAEMVREFWKGISLLPWAKIVTFNGRGFDLPLL